MEKYVTGISKYWSARYILAYMAFLGFTIVYLLRVNLSVALVSMVKSGDSHTTAAAECPQHTNTSSTPDKQGTFDWDKVLQGQVLGSFFYGYILTQIPGGWLAGRYGGKWLFGLGVFCTSVFTLVTPLAAKWNVYVFIVVRVLEGLGEGVTFPAMTAMWGVWAPRFERSILVTLSFAGAQFGTVIGLPLSGVITTKIGWEYVFYIFGVLGCVWFVAWTLIVHNTPDRHPRIAEEERLYINNNISDHEQVKITFSTTPWKQIFTSAPVYGNIIAHFAHNWGFYTLLTCLPTFMKDVLQFDISKDGLLSGVPYIFMWLCVWASGFLSDFLRKRRILSTTHTRKTIYTVGMITPAACLIGVGYVGCDYNLAVVLLCIAGAFDGISQSSFNVNQIDLSPTYAGTLMGITNTVATIPGFLGPAVVGWLTESQSTSETWRSVFYISAEVYVAGVLLYWILGSGEEQPWSRGHNVQPKILNGGSSTSSNDEEQRVDEKTPLIPPE